MLTDGSARVLSDVVSKLAYFGEKRHLPSNDSTFALIVEDFPGRLDGLLSPSNFNSCSRGLLNTYHVVASVSLCALVISVALASSVWYHVISPQAVVAVCQAERYHLQHNHRLVAGVQLDSSYLL